MRAQHHRCTGGLENEKVREKIIFPKIEPSIMGAGIENEESQKMERFRLEATTSLLKCYY